MTPDARADALERLRASYFDANGGPVYYEGGSGVLYWGPAGKAESLGLDPETVDLPRGELAQMEQEAMARMLWANAVPVENAPQSQARERSR